MSFSVFCQEITYGLLSSYGIPKNGSTVAHKSKASYLGPDYVRFYSERDWSMYVFIEWTFLYRNFSTLEATSMNMYRMC